MIKGEQHTVVIESLANSGDGVGRINDQVVFVPFTSPGDEVLVEITLNKKTFLKAKIIKIITASPERTTPRCSVFEKCGGCDWQHIPYDTQLKWKKKNLLDTLKKIGGISDISVVDDVFKSPSEYFYRNRIQVQIENNQFHYFEKNSHNKVRIQDCPLALPSINDVLKKPLTDKKKGKFELAEVDKKVQFFKVSSKGFSDLGFRQVNTEQNRKLMALTLDFIKTNPISTVVDLYCGQGNWSIEINNSLPHIKCVGIDIDPINIKKAQKYENENLAFFLGPVEKIAREKVPNADLVILDPPRSGCDASLLKLLTEVKISNLLYISCHPATLARDIKILTQNGWALKNVKPIDMFPQTAHLETWCLLHSAR